MIDQTTTKAIKSTADEKIPNVLKKYFNINGDNGFQLVDSTTLNQFLIKNETRCQWRNLVRGRQTW